MKREESKKGKKSQRLSLSTSDRNDKTVTKCSRRMVVIPCESAADSECRLQLALQIRRDCSFANLDFGHSQQSQQHSSVPTGLCLLSLAEGQLGQALSCQLQRMVDGLKEEGRHHWRNPAHIRGSPLMVAACQEAATRRTLPIVKVYELCWLGIWGRTTTLYIQSIETPASPRSCKIRQGQHTSITNLVSSEQDLKLCSVFCRHDYTI